MNRKLEIDSRYKVIGSRYEREDMFCNDMKKSVIDIPGAPGEMDRQVSSDIDIIVRSNTGATAITLCTSVVSDGNDCGLCRRYHEDSGWDVEGVAQEDYFTWVSAFRAVRGDDAVWGDFEDVVHATSLEAFLDFVKEFPPENWDYQDI